MKLSISTSEQSRNFGFRKPSPGTTDQRTTDWAPAVHKVLPQLEERPEIVPHSAVATRGPSVAYSTPSETSQGPTPDRATAKHAFYGNPGRWDFRRVALACLSLAGLILSSCAHCPRCAGGHNQTGAHGAMHGRHNSCSGCCSTSRTKVPGADDNSRPHASDSTVEKRKASAKPAVAPTQKDDSLWSRPTPPRWR